MGGGFAQKGLRRVERLVKPTLNCRYRVAIRKLSIRVGVRRKWR